MADPREELAELTRQARAWVEWLHDCGVDELHSETEPRQLLADLSAGLAASAHRPAARKAPPEAAPKREAPPSPAEKAAPAEPPKPTRSAASAKERDRRLAALAAEVERCTKCRLHESRKNTAFSRGSPDTDLVFVGEGPGAEEDRQGLPFVGPAGQLLDKMIAAMGYRPDEVYICNIVKCRPPKNRKPEPDEVAACAPYLQEQLALVNPKAMVALGATGVQGLIGTATGITRMRGTWKLYRGRIPLMPTFHPAYLLRSPEKKRDVWNDLKEVMHRLGKEPPAPKRRSSAKAGKKGRR